MSKKTSPSKKAEVKKPLKSSLKKAEVKKPLVSPEMANKALNLRQLYLSLSKKDQAACVHFFNLHNNAGWIYNELISQDARNYIDLQVAYSQELALIENSELDSDVKIDRLDQMINGDGN